jgi:hypothetical protein
MIKKFVTSRVVMEIIRMGVYFDPAKNMCALDDIVIIELPLQPNNTADVTAKSATSFGSCSFENYDYCNWHNIDDDGRDDFDWDFGNGRRSVLKTGPR